MSIANQCSSIMYDDDDDRMIPLDLRYTNFLKALSDIRDEGMRDRCHKYWTSLYQYLDRSMANERALLLEEKRTHEILHRLDIEMVSGQSEIAYQVQNILQRGHQVLSDLHLKYKRKTNNSKEIEENRIHKQKSEHSLTSDFNTISSSTSRQLTTTIDNLKLEIKNLQITRTCDTIKTRIQLSQFRFTHQYCRRYFSNRIQYQKSSLFLNTYYRLSYSTDYP